MESPQPGARLDNRLVVERVWTPDRNATLAALRLILGLQRPLPKTGQETRQ
jgi:hypothetical protein